MYRCGREGHIAVYCGKGQGRETSRGKLLRQQLSVPKSEGAYHPTHNRGSGGGGETCGHWSIQVHNHNG